METSENYDLLEIYIDKNIYPKYKSKIKQRVISKCPVICFSLRKAAGMPVFDVPTPIQYVLLPEPPKSSEAKSYIEKIFSFFMD